MPQPVWLSIVLFMAFPGTYAALLTVLAEHYLKDGGPFMTASISLAGAPLLLWLPLAPGFGLLILSLLAFEAIRRTAPQQGRDAPPPSLAVAGAGGTNAPLQPLPDRPCP